MKYFKKYKEAEAEAFEITKEEAQKTLEGWWNEKALNECFEKEKAFRLWTAFSEVWTETEEGLVPMAGFYGICE